VNSLRPRTKCEQQCTVEVAGRLSFAIN